MTSFFPAPRSGFPLICFPHAGGSPALFGGWQAKLPGIDILGATLPGRGMRMREAPIRDWETLLRQITLPTDRDYALYGHSLGALIAFEAARRARRPPVHLFLSARRAPGVPETDPPIIDLDERRFLDAIERRYGKLPAALRANRELLEMFLPPLRADLRLLEKWVYRPRPYLSVPITVFGGTTDTQASQWMLEPWALQTSGPFRFVSVDGGHFFPKDSPAQLHEAFRALL